MRQIIKEAFNVARSAGVELFWKQPEEYIDCLFSRLIPVTAAHHPSMLQDIQRQRRTEIDALNGAIVKLGEQHGVNAPINRFLTSLIKSLESRKMNE
jgi:2-dehydropantoate 2-reductase